MTINNDILISICIPTYNRYELLKRAVKSCLDNIEDFEIIIQDNHSTDSTSEIINYFNHPKIKYARNSENIGPTKNLIKTIERATGEYILILTDDDYLLTGALDIIRDFIKLNNPDVFKTDLIIHLVNSKSCSYYSYGKQTSLADKFDYNLKANIYLSAHIFTGLCFKREEIDINILIKNNHQWYPSQLIVGLLAEKRMGYIAEPIAMHTWENETFWGIEPTEKNILNKSIYDTIETIQNSKNYPFIKEILLNYSKKNVWFDKSTDILNDEDYAEIKNILLTKNTIQSKMNLNRIKTVVKKIVKRVYKILANYFKPIKINIGSGGIVDDNNWIATDIHNLNITKETDWNNILRTKKAKYMVAEHVWEHLSDYDTEIGNKLCFKYLKKGGVLRIAVPDGFHPDLDYINYVKPGGIGAGADDHKILYNYKIMTTRLKQAGFEVNLLEYWDEKGKFHYVDWDNKGGKISRSRRYDLRNKNGELKYTSLIVDAIKK